MQKSLYNLKNMKKKTDGGVLLLVTLQALACNFTKNNTPPWVFFTFFKLHKWFKTEQKVSYSLQDMSHPKNTHPNSNINSNIPFFNLHRYNKTVNKWKITYMWRNISIWHLLMNLRNNYLFNKLLMWANKKCKNFNIYNKTPNRYQEISLFYTYVPKILMMIWETEIGNYGSF